MAVWSKVLPLTASCLSPLRACPDGCVVCVVWFGELFFWKLESFLEEEQIIGENYRKIIRNLQNTK